MGTTDNLRFYGGADAYLATCPSRQILDVLANKWTMLVMGALSGGPMRFGELSGGASLWRDFADAFVDADLLAVTAIYAAGQQPIEGVTGKLIVDAVLDAHPRTEVAWLPDRTSLRRWLLDRLRPGDLCLTLGAGDLTTLPVELLGALRTA